VIGDPRRANEIGKRFFLKKKKRETFY
jgi:hypothetical protein